MIGILAGLVIAGQTPSDAPGDAPAIRLNQIGFETEGPKVATLVSNAAAPIDWRLEDASGRVAARGVTRPRGRDAASGDPVHVIVLDDVREEGRGFRLVAGQAVSRPFDIGPRPWVRLKVDAFSYFYQNRAGVPILADHVARPDLAREAGHQNEIASCFSGPDLTGRVWEGCDYRLDVTGGWYDAGDHGKYVVNAGISVWTLLNLWERAQASGAVQPFADGRAALPEAGNGVDDLLDEVRFELEFLLRMQVPAGASATVPIGRDAAAMTRIDAGGMAHHAIHDVTWTSLPLAPADAPRTRLLTPPTTAATLNLAATGAQCARIWRTTDPDFAALCLTAAQHAWTAALANPHVYRTTGFDGGGPYSDDDLDDEWFWAAAELYLTTGEASYAEALTGSAFWPGGARSGQTTGEPGFAVTAPLGAISLITLGRAPSDAGLQALRDGVVETARGWLGEVETQGYGLPVAGTAFHWGSNGALMNRAMVLAVAHDLSGERAFRDGVIASLDYLLGRNPLDVSYISGWGARPMEQPHHRFWAYGAGADWPRPPAGVLSGGANNTNFADPVAQTIQGCEPLKCWIDDIGAYALNEVTINWNAPLVWVAAWLDPD